MASVSLVPPSLGSSTEVILGPWGEKDLAIFGNIAVGKSERKRGRSTNDGSGRSVLGSVARAHEFVLGSRPWNDTSQVSAHCKIGRIGNKDAVRQASNNQQTY